ncbi:MAG: nickel pincer cofactor biosynthesis protein LarB [Peptococcaceae bacterium]|nr:nickel pincer cofactor biosynthesis protein LarB [Peptococcaceae bacterium]
MKDKLRDILVNIQKNEIKIEEGLQEIEKMYYYDLGYAVLDTHRQFRKGFPEVIFCQGKTTDQIISIARKLDELSSQNILATRANREIYFSLQKEIPSAEFNEIARTIVIRKGKQQEAGNILVVSAGTSDLPVAEEAAVTAEIMGNKVERMYDTGVAGLHRLLSQSERLLQARVVIVVAGMDGALPSVVAGLISKPVVAVPTSVGYGANFGGLSALLTMLNSCSAGIGVVNIDNGFGAGYLASLINQPEN